MQRRQAGSIQRIRSQHGAFPVKRLELMFQEGKLRDGPTEKLLSASLARFG